MTKMLRHFDRGAVPGRGGVENWRFIARAGGHGVFGRKSDHKLTCGIVFS